jgi:exopolysaccharide biosynthesis polyprenyl glycosylphosphotransferase
LNVQLRDALPAIRLLGYPNAPILSLKSQRLILKLWLIATDVIALALAFMLAFWIRFDLQLTAAPEVLPPHEFYGNLIAILLPVWILVFLTFNLYSPQTTLGGSAEYARVFNACGTSVMILLVVAFFVPQFIVSRVWLVSSWLLSFLFVSLARFLNRRLVYFLRSYGYFLTPSVIVGTNREAATLASDLGDWRSSGLRIFGFVSSRDADTIIYSPCLPLLGDVKDIHQVIAAHGIEDLIVAVTALDRDELLQLGEDVNGIPNVNLRLSSGLYELLTTDVIVKKVGAVPLLSVNKVRLAPEEIYLKTLLDYTLITALAIFALPIFFLLAILIKLDSHGPVFHRRRVLGVSGKQFDAIKFRTMYENADELLRNKPELKLELQSNHKLKEDPRVTRIGRWLRRFSLDELPQFLNVFLGQMSLVGPRMITPSEAKKYGFQKLNLLTVKPGLTGLWQVSGRSDLSYDDRVRLDLYYIRNYSVWLDLQILFIQTLPAVLRSRGAY